MSAANLESEIERIKKEIGETQVIVLAGGKGKRMGYIDKPKPLLDVCGKPLINYTIETCLACGFRRFVFLLGYKHEEIESHLGDGSNYGAEFVFSVEPENVKGKGKAVKYALENNKIERDKRAIVMFPDDIILDRRLPIQVLIHHINAVKLFNVLATIVFVSGTEYPFGVGEIDSVGLVRKFEEKPFIQKYTSVGVYVFEPGVFDVIDQTVSLSEERDIELESVVFPRLANEGKLYSYVIPPAVWVPVNTVKEYERAEKIVKNFG